MFFSLFIYKLPILVKKTNSMAVRKSDFYLFCVAQTAIKLRLLLVLPKLGEKPKKTAHEICALGCSQVA
tara:strand:- start:1370 stop:1576 length:207 start_codon:yes stop_codon:yes gene_type:complete